MTPATPAAQPFARPPYSLRDRNHLLAIAVSAAVLGLAPAIGHAQTATSGSVTTAAETLPTVTIKAKADKKEQHTPGEVTTLTSEDMEKTGTGNIADVVKYQPLVEAPDVSQGATRGKSRFDRGGTTGYNIRGIEGNRVGLDVDGVEMPEAVSRAPATNRAQDGTFGMGRDFIDPEMYSSVDIQSGTTNSRRNAGGIGGAVSFRGKVAADYVSDSKPFYIGGKLGYNDNDESWLKAVTGAIRAGSFDGLISYARRDGKQGKNNSDVVESYPDKFDSDALLLKGDFRLNSNHKLGVSADIYRRSSDSEFSVWNSAATEISGRAKQDGKTKRDTFQLSHNWTPANGFIDQLDTRVFMQKTDMDDTTYTTTVSTGNTTSDWSQNKNRQIGFSSSGDKQFGIHTVRFGINASENKNEHPLVVSDASTYQPFPDTTTRRYGFFVEDTIAFQVGGKRLALVPGLRIDRVDSQIRNVDDFDQPRIDGDGLEQFYGNAPKITIASPSLSILYDLQPNLTAYAQWKRSGRAPSNAERFGYWNSGGPTYALVGNKDLKKETSDAFDIGLKGSPTRGVTFSASAFYTKYSDFISYTRFTKANNPELFVNTPPALTILYQAENRDDAKIYGAEFSTRLEHGVWAPSVKGLYSTIALGYSKGTSKSNYAGDKNVPLDSVQPAKAILGLGYDAEAKAWGASLNGVFVKSKQAVATNRQSFSNDPGSNLSDSTTVLFRVPGYARFDLHGYYRMTKNARINASILNLTDKRYWDYSSARSLQPASAQDRQQIELSTAPGRTFSVALSVDF